MLKLSRESVCHPAKVILPASGAPCTGCGLCVSACPHKAIRLAEDTEGFLIAKVNSDLCVGCKVCEKMCERLGKVQGHDTHRFYEAWSKDEAQRRTSSSGGVFGELAADCIHHGGVVFGVAMRGTDFPRFVAVERTEDLQQLRGSKYLQADPGHVFAEVAAALKAGRPVLFAGTSCQVRAARVRFGERYPNLLLVDLACFGTPSRLLFRRFVAELGNQSGIADMRFRDKTRGWRQYGMRIKYVDGTEIFIPKEDNPFMKGFLSHLGVNACCYSCRSAINERPGDISLGDFWAHPSRDNERNGVSVVITHTSKGESALTNIRPLLHLQQIEEELALSRNGGLVAHHAQVLPLRAHFLLALKKHSLNATLQRFLTPDGKGRLGISICGSFMPYPLLLVRLIQRIRRRLCRLFAESGA